MEKKIQCLICKNYYFQITNTHLATHNLTPSEYKSLTGAEVYTEHIRKIVSKKLSKVTRGKDNPFYGCRHTKESKRKMSASQKGKKKSPEHKKKIGASNKGKILSKKTRLRISKSKKGKPSPFKGQHHTEETKRELSIAKKGKSQGPLSESHKENISFSKKGERNPMYGKLGAEHPMYGRKRSQETLRRFIASRTGKCMGSDNPMWKGGLVPSYGPNWHKQRQHALEQVEFTCELTGTNGGVNQLDVHHIISVRKFHEQFLRVVYPSLYKIASENSNFFGMFEKCLRNGHLDYKHFRGLPVDSIFLGCFYDEVNHLENLIVLNKRIHTKFESMPPAFFEALRHL